MRFLLYNNLSVEYRNIVSLSASLPTKKASDKVCLSEAYNVNIIYIRLSSARQLYTFIFELHEYNLNLIIFPPIV